MDYSKLFLTNDINVCLQFFGKNASRIPQLSTHISFEYDILMLFCSIHLLDGNFDRSNVNTLPLEIRMLKGALETHNLKVLAI